MHESLLNLSPEVVRDALLKNGIAQKASDLHLDPIPRNPERRDFLTRVTFRVRNDASASDIHLTVGLHLADLWRRSCAFAEACPDISCRPIFFETIDGLEYLGVEHLAGTTLDALITRKEVSTDDVMRHLERLVSSLEKSITASTHEAAADELESLLEGVSALPIFCGLDQRFLREFVFPSLRAHARPAVPCKRWSNGDFIPRNIIVDATGNPRIVDYEFACNTHYFGEDAWRWKTIASLPSSFRAFPAGATAEQSNPWLEALFFLKQIKLSHDTSGAQAALARATPAINYLLRLASDTHDQFRASVFYSSLGESAAAVPKPSPKAFGQLYWSRNGVYSENASQRCDYESDADTTLCFEFSAAAGPLHLRFDPSDAPGVITISGVRIRGRRATPPLLHLDRETGWQRLKLASELHALAYSPGFKLLSTGNDPHFALPQVELDSEEDIVCEIDLKFTRDVASAAALLQSRFDAETKQAVARAQQLLDTREAELSAARQSLDARASELSTALKELATLRQALDAETSAHTETSRLLQHTHEIVTEERGAQSEVAQEIARLTLPIEPLPETVAKQSRSWPAKLLAKRSRPTPAKFEYNFDTPSDFENLPPTTEIVGWLFSRPGYPILAIRARSDRTIWPSTGPIFRPDVAAYHPGAGRFSGFKIPYAQPETSSGTPFLLHFEALLPDGKWHEFTSREIRPPARPSPAQPSSNPTVEYERWLQHLPPGKPPQPLPTGPVISVVMPVYNTPKHWLERTIESVLRQSYDRWELCIANDGSTAPHVRPKLDEYAARDPRIKVIHRPQSGHISAASNSGLELVTGDFVAFLDHDDELTEDALYRVAESVVANPACDIFYSDEDKLDEDGHRCEPFFKPDFDLDLLLGLNYVCHFLAIRSELVREIGGFRIGIEGSQDHDLLLRALVKSRRVHHIPRILYHWRKHNASIAASGEAKPYAHRAGSKAIQDFLDVCYPGARVADSGSLFAHRVIFPIKDTPTVSIIVPFRDKPELLQACVDSIRKKTRYPHYEILLVDNNSSDPRTEHLLTQWTKDEPRCRVLRYRDSFNFSKINNFAAQHASGEHLLLLNNDTVVINEDWIDEMLMHSVRPEVGAVGALLLYPNNTVQHAGIVLGMTGLAGHIYSGRPPEAAPHGLLRFVRSVSAVTAACLMTKRELFISAGGLDEQLTVCGNDVDLCLRYLRLGLRNIFTPFAKLYHFETATRDPHKIPRGDFARSIDVYAPTIASGDPYYNPNLSLLDVGAHWRTPGEGSHLVQLVSAVAGHDTVAGKLCYQGMPGEDN